jgi:hypothetical protein
VVLKPTSVLRRTQDEAAVLAQTGAGREGQGDSLAAAPEPPYRPQEIKKRLAPAGWVPEVRVPPFDAQHDELPINERYDMWKPFELDGERIGVAVEMERWEVWNDLLKFRRGIERGQIAVGVILHDNPESLSYVYDHLRLISEPLFGMLPVAFVAPEGAGLKEPSTATVRQYAPYRMPNNSTLGV